MSDYTCLRVETSDRITTVTLARPERRNAVDGVMAGELYDAFVRFDSDPQADVAILYGEGGTFCAGADLSGANLTEANLSAATLAAARLRDVRFDGVSITPLKQPNR